MAGEMKYTHFQHRHNFAAWCAARAVQRGFAKTQVLKGALEESGVVDFIKTAEDEVITQDVFEKLHGQWCDAILKNWIEVGVKGATYGRAAKLLAVYIKSMIVVRNDASRLSEIAHPPIDRILLKNISRDITISHPNRAHWGEINWTQLTKPAYSRLVSDFKEVLQGRPFWTIEKYWVVEED
jgi:hypothetical protein